MAEVLAGPQGLLWTLNARAVLTVLDEHGPLGRPELVALTGLSRTTIAQTVAVLLESGAIVSAGIDHDRRGPAAQLYRIASDRAFGLAIHVATNSTSLSLIDIAGTIRAHAEAPSTDLASVIDAVRACLAQSGVAGLRAITVAVPGVVGIDHRTLRTTPADTAGDTSLHDGLAAAFGCQVTLENDVNLAALAEQQARASDDIRDFVVLSLDHGFGAALVIDGRIRRGSAGGAGEISYLPQPGLPLGEPVLSDAGIAELAIAVGLDPTAGLDGHLVAARTGDTRALALIATVGERLATAAASVALVLEPEVFVLGRRAADPLIVGAAERFAATRLAPLSLRFVCSTLGHDDSLLGATQSVRTTIRDLVFDEATRPPSSS